MTPERRLPTAVDTDRLYLRPWRTSDAEPLREMWGERDPREVPGFIGYCGLIVGQASESEPEIAFELLRRFHNRGYATEAAYAVIGAIDTGGWTRLWSRVRETQSPHLHGHVR